MYVYTILKPPKSGVDTILNVLTTGNTMSGFQSSTCFKVNGSKFPKASWNAMAGGSIFPALLQNAISVSETIVTHDLAKFYDVVLNFGNDCI